MAAQALRGSGFTIGFEIPHLLERLFRSSGFRRYTGLAASKYQLILAPGLGYRGARSALEALIDRQVDGIITIGSEVERTGWSNVPWTFRSFCWGGTTIRGRTTP